jgi:hypothetical protein
MIDSLPYHESDHVLNIAYKLLAGGTCLEHLEYLRNDDGLAGLEPEGVVGVGTPGGWPLEREAPGGMPRRVRLS